MISDAHEIKVAEKTLLAFTEDEAAAVWGWWGEQIIFVLHMGEPAEAEFTRLLTDGVAAAGEQFRQLAREPVIYTFSLKPTDLLNRIGVIMDADDGEEFANVRKALENLGLNNMREIRSLARFTGADISIDEAIELTGPRKGLLAQFKPVDAAWLAQVDSRATGVTMAHVDASGIFDCIMQTIRSAVPEKELADVEKGLAQAEKEIGFKIRDDLLASFAGPVILQSFTPGTLSEAYMGGGIITANLTNTEAFTLAMVQIENLINDNSDGMIQVQTMPAGEQTLHVWSCPPMAMLGVTPVWTVQDNRLVCSSNMPMMELMRQRLGAAKDAPENSFLQSSPWKTLQATVPPSLLLFQYEDTAATIKYMRNTMQQFWPMVVMGIQKQGGLQLPAILPMVDHLVQNISYSTAYAWADDTTLRYHSEGPMGTMSTSSMSGVAGGALGVSILMPALGRARELANQVKCATQLNGIGKAIALYQNDYQGKNPPTLQALIETEDLVPMMFVCPTSGDDEGDCSYIYRGADLDASASSIMILAHDKYDNHDGENRNVLFADMHVKKVTEEEFQQLIEADNQKRKEMGLAEIPADGPGVEPTPMKPGASRNHPTF